jgi:hypothetical protein
MQVIGMWWLMLMLKLMCCRYQPAQAVTALNQSLHQQRRQLEPTVKHCDLVEVQ